MTLLEFIEKIKAEHNISTSTGNLEKMINKRARAAAGQANCVAIDNETVKGWILEYEGWKADDDKKAEEAAKLKAEFDAEQAKKKAQREAEARAKAEAEEKAKREKEGQLSLWDL